MTTVTRKVSSRILIALAGLMSSWALLMIASAFDIWQASFVVVLLAAGLMGWALRVEGYFHPVFLFCGLALVTTLVGLIWMTTRMNGTLTFGAYFIEITPQDMFLLAREQLLLLASAYLGFLVVSGFGSRRATSELAQPVSVPSPAWLWAIFYALGVLALLYLILASGGFATLFDSLGEKYERAAGRGWAVLIVYFAYVGALLWYVRNSQRPAWQRYGGLVLLLFPMLLTGSRTDFLICLLAAAYIDEKAGQLPKERNLLLAGISIAVFFAVYQLFRGQADYGLLTAVSKDLSMGVGYVIAVRENTVGGQFRPATLWLAISPFLPGRLESVLGVPASPNYVFTQARVPGALSTQSMGVMGEANYTMRYGWSFFYYFVVGGVLTWIENAGRRNWTLLNAVLAGSTFRMVKGGVTVGIANALLLIAPLIAAAAVCSLIGRVTERKGKSDASED